MKRVAVRTRVFVSHVHEEVELAKGLVNLFDDHHSVPSGEQVLATSVENHQFKPGARILESLKNALCSTDWVLVILTPQSLSSTWVLLELGAAWALAKNTVPLLAGGIQKDELPPMIQGLNCYDLADSKQIKNILTQIGKDLDWKRKAESDFDGAVEELCQEACNLSTNMIHASLARQREYIGAGQRKILGHLAKCEWVYQDELFAKCAEICRTNAKYEPYFRIEQLHLLGLVRKRRTNPDNPTETPAFEYSAAPHVKKFLRGY